MTESTLGLIDSLNSCRALEERLERLEEEALRLTARLLSLQKKCRDQIDRLENLVEERKMK